MTWLGRRVDSRKTEGLFSKLYRPNRYGWISTAGSPSGGSDLPWVRSNQGRPKRIGWPGLFAGDGGGGTHGARRRAAAESPELVKLGRPGLDSSGAMAWEWVRIMRNPLGPTSGLGVARSGERDCGGGSAPASACASIYWALRPTISSAKREKRSTRCSPRDCGGRSYCARRPASSKGGGAGGAR